MKYVLAPLAGFTDAPFRRLASEGGADLVYTEMVSAAAIAHGHSPTHQLMETMAGEGPTVCQIFGAKPDEIAVAAAEVEKVKDRFAGIDLNAGCPMTKVTKCGAGAELVKSPERIYELLKAMKENTSLPVSVKTRLGPHPKSTTVFEILDAAEHAGAVGITVHARYTSQMHGGTVHLDRLAEVVERSKIPVTGNGSVTDAKSAAEMSKTGVAAIMIGRAAMSAPYIFAKLKGATEIPDNRELFARHLKYLLEFRRQLVERFPQDRIPSEDGYASVKMHVHLFRYFNGQPGAAALRARLNSVRTLSEIASLTGWNS